MQKIQSKKDYRFTSSSFEFIIQHIICFLRIQNHQEKQNLHKASKKLIQLKQMLLWRKITENQNQQSLYISFYSKMVLQYKGSLTLSAYKLSIKQGLSLIIYKMQRIPEFQKEKAVPRQAQEQIGILEESLVPLKQSYFLINEFLAIVAKHIQEKTFIQFQRLFLWQLNREKQNSLQKFSYHMPLYMDEDKQYFHLKILMFVKAYTGIALGSEAHEKIGSLEKIFLQSEQFPRTEKRASSTSKDAQQRGSSLKPKRKRASSVGKHQIIPQNQLPLAIPIFIQQQVLAFDALISVSFTDKYRKELQNVKTVIRRQINSQYQDGLILKYIDFLKEFMEFKIILKDQYDCQLNQEAIEALKLFNINDYFNNWKNSFNQKNFDTYLKDLRKQPYIKKKLVKNAQILVKSFEEDKDQSSTLNQCSLGDQNNQLFDRNIMLDIWRTISKGIAEPVAKKIRQMEQHYKDYGGLAKKISQILLEGLNHIHLASRKTPKIYGNIIEKSIIININHRGYLSDKQCRSGPLQPFICLCIYHQLTHLLIREFDQFGIGDNNSFDFSSQSFGSIFLNKLVPELSFETFTKASYLNILKQPKQEKKIFLDQLEQSRDKIKHFFQKFRSTPDILKDQLKRIKYTVHLFSKMFFYLRLRRPHISLAPIFKYIHDLIELSSKQPIKQLTQQQLKQEAKKKEFMLKNWKLKMQYDQKLSSLFEEYEELQQLGQQKNQSKNIYKKTSKQTYKQLILELQQEHKLQEWMNQRKYKIFFSLFATEQIFKNWIKQSESSLYQQVKNKLASLHINKYFIKKNQEIEKFVQSLINRIQGFKEIFFSSIVDQYSQYVLDRHITCQKNYQEMIQYCRDIDKIHLNDFIRLAENAQSYIAQSIFVRYDLLSFIACKQKQRQYYLCKNTILFDLFMQNQELTTKMTKIFEIDCYKQIFLEVLQLSQLYEILFQLPGFFTSNAFFLYESGYDIERKLFPNLGNKIYSKDYFYMKNINSQQYRAQVGKQPSQQKERRLFMNTGKQGKQDSPHIDISQRQCWTHKLGQVIANTKRQIKQLQVLQKKIQEESKKNKQLSLRK